MIDARLHHDPKLAGELLAAARAKTKSQAELAARLGVTTRYLQQLAKEEKHMSYGLQVMLEMIAAEADGEFS